MAKRFSLFILIFVFLGASLVFNTDSVDAAFNKNNVMSDLVFSDKNSMTAGQIDVFLNSFPSSCISTNNGFSAKKPIGYSSSTGKYSYSSGYTSAGSVIYAAAQAYDLNPRVIIATLQKEQSLVSGGSGICTKLAYTAAMGNGCPDNITSNSYGVSPDTPVSLYRKNGVTATSVSGTCVNTKSKAGFSQQVITGTWLLKYGQQRSLGNVDWAIIRGSWDNSDDLGSSYSGPMVKGNRKRCADCATVYFDGVKSLDGTTVTITNGATAALYWYTPHLHGNQLFVSTFEGWFGSTQKSVDYRLIECSGQKYLVERFIKMKRTIPDSAVSEFGLTGASFATGDVGCGYNTFAAQLGRYVRSRNTKKVYLVDNSNAYRLQGSSIARAWDLMTEYTADNSTLPQLNGTTIAGLLDVSYSLPRFAKSDNTGKTYLIDRGKRFHISGTPEDTSFLSLFRGYNEIASATFSADYLSDQTTAASALGYAFNSGGKWYVADHGKIRLIHPSHLYRWDSIISGPSISTDFLAAIPRASTLSDGFRRDSRYYRVTSTGTIQSTTNKSTAKSWGVSGEPLITQLLVGKIL